ncbi:MerR family transcriptional regulator [Microbacterium luticocti]|uniref:MerR family transcriptional regulator n=1 Tax=Microbacterium luticocti TaxID=451764 RepID=UPI0004188015|nr:MerR family transcriptional regulator [Microbacterium luticocti]
MRIGELSRRTGVATRLLRYYEAQGLLESTRSLNGYRDYTEADVDTVTQIRGLLSAGLTTRLIRMILDMEGVRGSVTAAQCTRTVAGEVAEELARVEERLRCLSQSSATMRQWLTAAGYEELAPAAPSAPQPQRVTA